MGHRRFTYKTNDTQLNIGLCWNICNKEGADLAYKIAVGSSDGRRVDLKFGEVKKFIIYEVCGEQVELHEVREVGKEDNVGEEENFNKSTNSACKSNGCGGYGTGCSGPSDVVDKVSAISDCRCVVCKKIGFQAKKQFEKKAISVFDVECEVEQALKKIAFYYGKLDRHESITDRR